MKRILYTLAAVATLASCSNDELVEVTPKQAITFGNAFVENATRAIDNTLNTNTLTSFNVYGTVTGTGANEGTVNIFNGVEVTKNSGEGYVSSSDGWGYSAANTQYWIEGNNYKFVAVVNGNVTTGENSMPTTISYDATSQSDLLYAENVVTGYPNGVADGTVKFTFDHLLSKVQFTFKNTMITNTAAVQGKGDGVMYTYKVSDVKITNAYKGGTYAITNKVWNVTTGESSTSEVDFGNISNATESTHATTAIAVGDIGKEASATSHYQRLLIPNDYKVSDTESGKSGGLTITYTLETCLNGTVINTENCTINNVAVNLESGNAYNFIISKGNPGSEIKFSVEKVNEWNTDLNNNQKEDDDITLN